MTITAKEPRASESNHWYTRDGIPRYTVMGKNGKERNTTLRDARTENLVPSVTTVLTVMAKPALIQWLQKQVLMAALTLPVDAVVQPEDAEDVLVELSGQVAGELLLELLDVGFGRGINLDLHHRV